MGSSIFSYFLNSHDGLCFKTCSFLTLLLGQLHIIPKIKFLSTWLWLIILFIYYSYKTIYTNLHLCAIHVSSLECPIGTMNRIFSKWRLYLHSQHWWFPTPMIFLGAPISIISTSIKPPIRNWVPFLIYPFLSPRSPMFSHVPTVTHQNPISSFLFFLQIHKLFLFLIGS